MFSFYDVANQESKKDFFQYCLKNPCFFDADKVKSEEYGGFLTALHSMTEKFHGDLLLEKSDFLQYFGTFDAFNVFCDSLVSNLYNFLKLYEVLSGADWCEYVTKQGSEYIAYKISAEILKDFHSAKLQKKPNSSGILQAESKENGGYKKIKVDSLTNYIKQFENLITLKFDEKALFFSDDDKKYLATERNKGSRFEYIYTLGINQILGVNTMQTEKNLPFWCGGDVKYTDDSGKVVQIQIKSNNFSQLNYRQIFNIYYCYYLYCTTNKIAL